METQVKNSALQTIDLPFNHQQIFDRFRAQKPQLKEVSDELSALIAYNGYYSINSAPGAFFAIDTNIYVYRGFMPHHVVSFLISLDGITSFSVDFTGTFDGSRLLQNSNSIQIDLTFTRTNGADGTTATCAGTLSVNNSPMVQVSGSTYNNPIPIDVYIGSYYSLQTLHVSTNKKEQVVTKVMEIGSNNDLYYDFGSNDGVLKPVEVYIYNLNMYYFSFDNKQDSLIMGTAGASGFACNNMCSVNGNVVSRSLQTIVNPTIGPFQTPNLNSYELASFSGYYPLPSISPLAFLSIQAEYAIIDNLPLYSVVISVSLDGVTSNGYYFDWSTMSFSNNTLVMNEQQITLNFQRIYNPSNGSLVTVTGNIGNYGNLVGYTLLNPVPLSAFGGVALTNNQGDSLTIISDMEVIYNGTVMTNFIYVPLMYILANPVDNTTTVFSLGTAGTKGTACIVIDVPTNKISFIYGIPNG